MKAKLLVQYTDRHGNKCKGIAYPVVETADRFVCLRIAGSNVDFTWKEVEIMPSQADIDAGYWDRIAGYYDKWYRYNRFDNGNAYDIGCKKAVESGKCPEHFTLIEG